MDHDTAQHMPATCTFLVVPMGKLKLVHLCKQQHQN